MDCPNTLRRVEMQREQRVMHSEMMDAKVQLLQEAAVAMQDRVWA
jgi:hypothetical protein